METAGRDDVEDEEARQALKDCGIGTPATRAAIIETLIRREYMVRVKKSLVPTEKGLALYSIVKDMDIANVEMTGRWKRNWRRSRKERPRTQDYHNLLACDRIFGHKASGCTCPKCGKGTMQFYGKVVRCDNPDCALPVFRQIAGKTLTDGEITGLPSKAEVLGGFKSRQGKPLARTMTSMPISTNFIFPEAKGAEKRHEHERKTKIMRNFATGSCHNLFQSVDTLYSHGFSGGTRRDTGCLFLSFPKSFIH